ncbi:hypothetical protein EV360DRAFT_89122 [Lentinula raphanica]|nr:hypothetical protein EV360DRAFT_89122 [Lentinula raphanica]
MFSSSIKRSILGCVSATSRASTTLHIVLTLLVMDGFILLTISVLTIVVSADIDFKLLILYIIRFDDVHDYLLYDSVSTPMVKTSGVFILNPQMISVPQLIMVLVLPLSYCRHNDHYHDICSNVRGGSGIESRQRLPSNPSTRFQTFIPCTKFTFQIDASTQDQQTPHYPPPPLTQSKVNKVISQWNEAFSPDKFQEAGCVVCGQLTPVRQLSPIKHVSNLLSVLEADGVTRKQRSSTHDPIQEHTGPVLDHSAGSRVCDDCRSSLRKGSVPKLALAHGLWLGDVPDVLKNLTFYEKILIARVQHTRCFVRVQKSAGNKYCKLVSNVIAFENPTPHIYNVLPPPRKDMDDVLAVMFSGTSKPTDDDYKNALLLLRHHVIAPALEWLIVNHFDYTDVTFSPENLAQYPENVPPVAVEFFKKGTNRNAEGVSIHDSLEDDGVDGDQCVFTVHGVVGDSLKNMTTQQLKGIAAQHLDNEGKFLRVAHSSSPESLWNNTHLYPKMFPWLFPYGLGGLGAYNASHFSEKSHLKFLLNYHDKRFQLDESFPFVAFNQQQIKAGTSQAFLMADSNKFDAIRWQQGNMSNLPMRRNNCVSTY